ncbi:hypothetical protein [Candidatus Spongiisocius sp.]|uniref:hypothetical protein n=1 Tax=Candidatus Spongiisocius sp. TaxID=3101273 RepID=UPI003B58E341
MIFGQQKRKPDLGGGGFYAVDGPDNCFYDVAGESLHQEDIESVAQAGSSFMRTTDGVVRIMILKPGDAPGSGRWREHPAETWDIVGVVLWLVAEPANEWDPNAVGVWADPTGHYRPYQSVLVGYIPRQDTVRISGMLQRRKAPERIKGTIVGRHGRWGVKLDIDAMDALLRTEERTHSVPRNVHKHHPITTPSRHLPDS